METVKRCLFVDCYGPWAGPNAHPHDRCAPMAGINCICHGHRQNRSCHDWMPGEPTTQRDRLVFRIMSGGADAQRAEAIADRLLTAYLLTEREEN